MQPPEFPVFVRGLPEVDLPIEGLRGWLLQSESGALLFLEAEEDGVYSPALPLRPMGLRGRWQHRIDHRG